jgi:hypothetical protein
MRRIQQRLSSVLAASVFALGSVAIAARPARAECPVDFNMEAILQALNLAQSCPEAINISRACAFGSSFDVQTTSMAAERCLAEMAPSLSEHEQTLNSLLLACQEKYAEHDGTLYRSATAFCALEVIEGFHAALTPAEPTVF